MEYDLTDFLTCMNNFILSDLILENRVISEKGVEYMDGFRTFIDESRQTHYDRSTHYLYSYMLEDDKNMDLKDGLLLKKEIKHEKHSWRYYWICRNAEDWVEIWQ